MTRRVYRLFAASVCLVGVPAVAQEGDALLFQFDVPADAGPDVWDDPPRRDDRVVPAEAIEFDNGRPAPPVYPGRRDDPAPFRQDDLLGVGVAPGAGVVSSRSASLKVAKQAPPRVAVGRAYVYEISVKNVGDEPAAGVVIEDLVPRGTRLEGTNPQARLEGKTLVWDVGTLAPGADRVVRVKVTPLTAGTVGSVATASFVSEVSSRTEVVSPALALTTGPIDPAAVGTPVEFVVTARNTGRADATDVLLRAALPPGLEHHAGSVVEHSVGTLAAGAETTVRVAVRPTRAGTFEIPIELVAAGGMRSETAATLTTAGTPISVTRDQPRDVVAGEIARSVTTVKNESRRVIDTSRLVERLPAGVTVISTPEAASFDPPTGTVAWDVGRLKPGESASFTIEWAAADALAADGAVRFDSADGAVAELAPKFTVVDPPKPEIVTIGLDSDRRDVPVGTRVRLAGRVDPGASPFGRVGPVRIAVPKTLRLQDVAGLKLTASRQPTATIYAADVSGPTEFTLELVAETTGDASVSVTTDGERAVTALTVTDPPGPADGQVSAFDFSAFE
ncbi:MAG: hypothetical protein AAF532_05360 [Planctomycetota bacterium]